MKTNVQRYLLLRDDLKENREIEEELLDKMDLLWQAMSLDEREEVRVLHLSWPTPAILKQDEDNGDT